MLAQETVFLKLGGSLITDKAVPRKVRSDILERIAREIKASRDAAPARRLLLGHGSGSFAHVPAKKYATRGGVRSAADWRGFVEVWRQASDLNRCVIDALGKTGLPALTFSPSAGALAKAGRIVSWDTGALLSALQAGLLPVVHGDVAFDRVQGGTIVSTEEVFSYLARFFQPARILIAGVEPGIWADYPVCSRVIDRITPANFAEMSAALSGSAHTDVTGGMAAKVREMSALAQTFPALEIRIFSGLESGSIREALDGAPRGTLIQANHP